MQDNRVRGGQAGRVGQGGGVKTAKQLSSDDFGGPEAAYKGEQP